SRFPRMIKDLYVAIQAGDAVTLKRFTPATRVLEPADWPETLAPVRAQLAHGPVASVWPDAPALVVSAPFLFVNAIADRPLPDGPVPLPLEMSYAVLLLDGNYIRAEVLPSLAQHHFQGTAGGSGYELAVVPTAGSGSIYHSVDGFNPKADAKADASADLFHLRLQDFGALVSEIRRFALFTGRTGYANATAKTVIRHTITAPPATPSPRGPTMRSRTRTTAGRCRFSCRKAAAACRRRSPTGFSPRAPTRRPARVSP